MKAFEIGDLILIKPPDTYARSLGIIMEILPKRHDKKTGSCVIYVDRLGHIVREQLNLLHATDDVIDKYGFTDSHVNLAKLHHSAFMKALEAAVANNDEKETKRYIGLVIAAEEMCGECDDGGTFDICRLHRRAKEISNAQ